MRLGMSNRFNLTGKVAVITGSSRGIARAIAEAMADQAPRVVISSRKADACAEAAQTITAKHGEGTACAIPANTPTRDTLTHRVGEPNRHHGRTRTRPGKQKQQA